MISYVISIRPDNSKVSCKFVFLLFGKSMIH